jgi:hypothetical protein
MFVSVHGCVHVALLIQHETRMHHIVTSFVAPLAQAYFSTVSHKRYDFWNKVIGHKTFVLIFSTNFFYNIYYFTKN